VTNHREYDEHPELLLAGADRPRSLPRGLRSRLEDALVATATATATSTAAGPARPLSAEVRDRLETSLRPERGPRTAVTTVPGPTPAPRWAGWRAITAVAGAAAAIVIVAAIVVPGLARGPHGQPTAAHSVPRARPLVPSGAVVRTKGPARNGPPQPVPTSRLYAPQRETPLPTTTLTPKTTRGPETTRGPGPASPPGPQAANAAQVAVVTAVNPGRGPARGGNWVVLDGQALAGARAVYFGTVPAIAVSSISAHEVKAQAPAHASGTVDVIVVTRAGRSIAATPTADRYVFVASDGPNEH
jgi:hypothetical protein